MLVALAQPVEELVRRQTGGVTVLLAGLLEFLGGASEEQSVERGLTRRAGDREALLVVGGQLLLRLRGRTPGERLGAQRLRPSAGWVAQLATQAPDAGFGIMER